MSAVRSSELTVSHSVREPAFLLEPSRGARVPPAVAAAALAAVAVLAVVWVWLSPIAAVALAIALLMYALTELRRERFLAVTPTGVVVSRPFATRRLAWDEAPGEAHPAVALYRDDPERRAAIGTPEELARLEADLGA